MLLTAVHTFPMNGRSLCAPTASLFSRPSASQGPFPSSGSGIYKGWLSNPQEAALESPPSDLLPLSVFFSVRSMIYLGPSVLIAVPKLSIIASKRYFARELSPEQNLKPLKRFTSSVIRSLPELEPKAAVASDGSWLPRSMILTSGASTRVGALLSMAMTALSVMLHMVLLLLLLPFRQRPPREGREGTGSGNSGQRRGHRVRRAARSSSGVASVLDVSKRRAIAMARVAEDREDDWTWRECTLFATTRGETMFTQCWKPVSGNVRGLLVILHGLNEHSGRYNDFAKRLNFNGFKVYGIDWIGHGGSNGLHGYVHSLDEAVDDIKEFIEKAMAENPSLPCFLFGHSTGGAIVLKAILDQKIQALVEGIVLTSPALRVQPSHPVVGVVAPVFSFLLPKYQFSAASKQGLPVCRDPEALLVKYSDPLVYTGHIRIRTGYEILRISSYLQQNFSRVEVPFLVLHGTADTVTDPEASRRLYEEACTADKSIKLYRGFLHDLLFEPEREEIMEDIFNWLNSKLNA